jgi:hypothetical protein
VRALCAEHGVTVTTLGTTGGDALVVKGLVHRAVADLRDIYEGALPALLASEAHA